MLVKIKVNTIGYGFPFYQIQATEGKIQKEIVSGFSPRYRGSSNSHIQVQYEGLRIFSC